MIRIALADDEPLFRSGISFLLQRETNIDVVFEASDGLELLKKLEAPDMVPEIILMDLKMPGMDGVESTKIITDRFPEVKIIVLTSYNTKIFIRSMIDIGASSYLVKNTTPTELITTINEVADKGFYYDRHVLDVLREDYNSIKNLKSNFDNSQLTGREKEIIKLICQQYSTKEIADKLFINYRTVEGHRNNLLLKTESKNMAGLVIYALKNEIINLQELVK
jgi:DNA-binding NarL/FixJ family response regulator